MEVNIKRDQHGQKIYKIFWPNTQLDFHLVDKNSGFSYDKEAVYILMDKFRRCFYIGEAGPTKSGGVSKRFQTHSWEKKFWDCALVISDTHGDFKQEDIRKWFEWRLNEIAKAANTAVVLSTAGKQDEPYGAKESLNAILSVCRLIGISWAFYEEENKEAEPAGKKVAKTKPAKAKPSAKETPKKELSKTQLAKFIANSAGKPGSYGHVWLILAGKTNKSGRKCGKNSEWRKPIEEVGVKFDKDDYVINWQEAKIPL